MTFNNSILLGLSASCKEHHQTKQARETYLSHLGSSSHPLLWKRDQLDLTKIYPHPSLCSKLKCYQDSLSLVDASHALKIQSTLSSLRAHLIKSSAIKDALLLLDAQKKTHDITISNMLLRHQTALYQSLMENTSPMIPVASRFMCGHIDEYLLSKKGKRSSLHTFPHRLHEIISNPEYSEYITWLPNGYAWKILQRKQFEAYVIPRHFRHGRFTSFMRQVNGWGFKRMTDDPDQNAYYHQYFVKGLPQLCSKMRRHSDNEKTRNALDQDSIQGPLAFR